MTPIPARLLRRQTDSCRTRPAHTSRDTARCAFIIEAAAKILIGALVGGDAVLNMLDCATMDLDKIEAATAAITAIGNARKVAANPPEVAMPAPGKNTRTQNAVRHYAQTGPRVQTLPHSVFRNVPQAAAGRYAPLPLYQCGTATPPRYAHQSGP